MALKINWVQIDKGAFAAIYSQFELSVFSSYTNPHGDELTPIPQIMTEWGFKEASLPFLKTDYRKESPNQIDWDKKYYIASVKEAEK